MLLHTISLLASVNGSMGNYTIYSTVNCNLKAQWSVTRFSRRTLKTIKAYKPSVDVTDFNTIVRVAITLHACTSRSQFTYTSCSGKVLAHDQVHHGIETVAFLWSFWGLAVSNMYMGHWRKDFSRDVKFLLPWRASTTMSEHKEFYSELARRLSSQSVES